jgi:prophage DNA circulation protein
MSADLYQANLAGIDIDCIDSNGTNDVLKKTIVRHRYPDTNGALLEDMGQEERVIQFTAVFIGAAYETHKKLIKALDTAGVVELVHPVYGILNVGIEQLGFRNNEVEKTAYVDFTLVEDLIGSGSVVTETTSPKAPVQASFLAGLAAQVQKLSQDIAADLRALSNAVSLRAYTAQMESLVSSVEGILSAIEQPANSLITTINFATDLPGRVIGAVAETVERYSALYETAKSAPARFVSSFRAGMEQLQDSLPESTHPAKAAAIATFAKHVRISGAMQLSLDLATLFDLDEKARRAQKSSAKTQSFDALGNYLNPPTPDPIMTINDIEQALADTRTELQTAVDLDRSFRTLQDMAAALLSHVDKIKLEREKITTVTIDGEMPLFLILLKYGLPYSMAERILAINPQIMHPSFVSGDVKIYTQ